MFNPALEIEYAVAFMIDLEWVSDPSPDVMFMTAEPS